MASGLFSPVRRWRDEFGLLPRERMRELDSPCVQTEGWSVDTQRLCVSHFMAREINRVAENRKTEVPKMNADLVGPSRHRSSFQQSRAVRVTLEHAKLSQ